MVVLGIFYGFDNNETTNAIYRNTPERWEMLYFQMPNKTFAVMKSRFDRQKIKWYILWNKLNLIMNRQFMTKVRCLFCKKWIMARGNNNNNKVKDIYILHTLTLLYCCSLNMFWILEIFYNPCTLERNGRSILLHVSSFNMGTLIRDLKSNYKENDYQILTLSTKRHIIYTTTIILKCLVGEKPYWKSLSPY